MKQTFDLAFPRGNGAVAERFRRLLPAIYVVIGFSVLFPAVALAPKVIKGAYHMHGLRAKSYETSERHRQALVQMGIFQRKQFPLSRTNVSNDDIHLLQRMIGFAALQDGNYTLTMPSNRTSISVACYRGDLEVWQRIVSAFDKSR